MDSPEDIKALFVYGTLRPGQRAWPRIEALVADSQPARLRGYDLFALPEGYPAAVPGEGTLVGDLLWPRDGHRGALLRLTDDYERYAPDDPASLFERVVTGRGHARAFLYLYHPRNAARLRQDAQAIPSGDWSATRGARA